MRRAAASLAALLAIAAGLPAAAAATTARASLTDIENDVMCVACHEPLAVAQSPQAYAERDYINGLIARGLPRRRSSATWSPSTARRCSASRPPTVST